MRISKNNDDEGLKTFNNIALRDEASETFNDGDLIKVIDASNDPNIKSGWAIYRYQISSKSYDLIEKEEQETIEIFVPDGRTTTEGFKNTDGNNKILVPDLWDIYKPDVKLLEDFDYDIVVKYWGGKNKLVLTPKGLGDKQFITIPVETAEGKKFLYLSELDLTNGGFNGGVTNVHWYVSGFLRDTDQDTDTFMSYGFDKEGRCPEFSKLYGGSDNQLPLFIVRAELGEINGFNTFGNIHSFKLWKKHVTTPAAPATEIEPIALDN
ncbi:MAG: hypothetical protein JEZ03_13440, partial [Bacteroidales bacterium]|nr:hypothetical protein [Bacteroidales bacterium]